MTNAVVYYIDFAEDVEEILAKMGNRAEVLSKLLADPNPNLYRTDPPHALRELREILAASGGVPPKIYQCVASPNWDLAARTLIAAVTDTFAAFPSGSGQLSVQTAPPPQESPPQPRELSSPADSPSAPIVSSSSLLLSSSVLASTLVVPVPPTAGLASSSSLSDAPRKAVRLAISLLAPVLI